MLKTACLDRPHHNLLPLPHEEIATRYRTGESTPALGRAYGVSHNTIYRRLLALGVEMRRAGYPGGRYARGGCRWLDKDGYLKTNGRDGKCHFVHRGCWEAYYGPVQSGWVVHHVDGDRRNNDVANLGTLPAGEHIARHWAEKRETKHGTSERPHGQVRV